MAHTYASEYPAGLNVDHGIKTFFEDFYKISDTGTEEAHELYADQFTADATLVMASKVRKGRDEILQIRKGMWEKVASRLHRPVKIFPFGEGAEEVMLYGTVKYVLKDGRKADVEWGARANLVKEEGKWKMGFYQVYLDTAAMQNAK
ncbi:uncharacterized protein LY89DRAFT_420878 [Mollisia scopiformis]|uniref:SnoaL-like domain-containing protein n=1 Tax=Mollisia scopiformis TaxID=149040 RepID=A0A194XLA9_MOLSC|nr:uncharacterized protein LY89DRAFT_420878 [Mollisia scopiformis]KUJ20963.1 hypothetical protein LY89DRAFT_420878 [Mollisia scopiformis]